MMTFTVSDALKSHIIDKILNTYGDDTVAIYGIGSAFQLRDTFRNADIDIVVILHALEKCPRKDFTTALFEKEVVDGRTINYGYSKYDDLFEKTAYEQHSFANWEWALRDLKYNSTFLYGKNIVEELPSPDYDYQAIFLRVAYWLDKTIRYGTEDAFAFSKSIFKFGFFLTAIHYPEKNCFDKHEILEALTSLKAEGLFLFDIDILYQQAIAFRERGTNFTNFKAQRIEFCKFFVRETIDTVNGASWDTLRQILAHGFDGKGMKNVISIIDRFGYI